MEKVRLKKNPKKREGLSQNTAGPIQQHSRSGSKKVGLADTSQSSCKRNNETAF